jgi:glycosyltransferase involved in cell wall biosynthesis
MRDIPDFPEPPAFAMSEAEAASLSRGELVRRHARLSAEFESLQAALEEIHRSRGWRLLNWCRKILDKALPPKSRRRRFVADGLRKLLQARQSLLRWWTGPPRNNALQVQLLPLPRTGRNTAEPDIRVAYIGSADIHPASMRYRAHNLVEALALHGAHGTFVPEEVLTRHFSEVLAHDLIVLVRRRWNPSIKTLIQTARQAGIPLVFDLDDYLFEPWILPYIDGARSTPASTLQMIKDFRTTLTWCDYFTGTTRFLVDRAAALRRPGWVIRNGLNAFQVERCRALLLQAEPRSESTVRIGYFSGTLTHHADFRVVYPALIRLLKEFPQVHLLVVGELDLGEFPGLQARSAQIRKVEYVDWRDLPALIASVDINIVPLERSLFTEGKSNLKYYEAGILKVPTIATPTEPFTSSIREGESGMFAASDEKWYQALKLLVTDASLRRRLGEQAHADVLHNFLPGVIAEEALAAYGQMIRARRGLASGAA